MIKLAAPQIGQQACDALVEVLKSGQLVHGQECELFEKELQEYLQCDHAVVVSSGTAALHVALIALGIGPGDAVIVPDFTFPATANVVEVVGARPILVDVDVTNYNIIPQNIIDILENWKGPEQIKAIMPVHEFGCPADMSAITDIAQQYDLKVIEDAACGLGATFNGKKVGSIGDIGCLSFHPRKALTTGEGGAILTNDAQLAALLRLLRNHGMTSREGQMDFILPGYNYRLTNFQAALGRLQLRDFDNWITERVNLQQIYRDCLAGANIVLPLDLGGHSWQSFMITLPNSVNRNAVKEAMKTRGIETNLGAYALHKLTYYSEKYPSDCAKLQGSNAEVLYSQGLVLPLYQGLQPEQIRDISQQLLAVLDSLPV